MNIVNMNRSNIQTENTAQVVNPTENDPSVKAGDTEGDDTQRYSARRHLWAIGVLLLLLVGGFGGWSVFTKIHGAVIAPGEFRSVNNRQLVQHVKGGTVSEIFVSNGDVVDREQVLMSLDSTDLKIERSVHVNRLLQTDAIIARLSSERDGQDSMEDTTEHPVFGKLPPEFFTIHPLLVDEINRNPYVAAQIKLFNSRQSIFQAQLEQLDINIQAKQEQLAAIGRQIKTKRKQGDIIRKEFNEIKQLVKAGHIEKSRVTDSESESVRLASELAQMEALLALTKGESAGLKQEKLRLISERQEAAIEQLREQELTRIELADTLRLNSKQLERTLIKAPADGVVTALSVHTVGGVVTPGEVLMTLAPINESLVIEAKVTPDMVDEVYEGQLVKVFLSSLNESNNPELPGTVINVSADRLLTENGSESFYHTEVQLTREAFVELQNLKVSLVSGMPVEVHLQTGARSPLNYLTKPLLKQINRALRES